MFGKSLKSRRQRTSSRRAFGDATNASRNVEGAKKGGKAAARKRLNIRSRKRKDVANPCPPLIPCQGIGPDATLANGVSGPSRSDSSDTNSCPDNSLCSAVYAEEMYKHFREKEGKSTNCMEKQTEINEQMRSILVDWLVEVHFKFKLRPETLYRAINILDRYMEKRNVERTVLQLVGITSLCIASKYEEVYPIELRDLVYICDRAYSGVEIINMEQKILEALSYQITFPSAHDFLLRFLKADESEKKIEQLANSILDSTLQSYRLLQYFPSQLAAAAVFIARRCVGRESWSPTLLEYANYSEEEVIRVARAVLSEKASKSPKLQAVEKKYSSTQFGGVANIALVRDF